MRHIDFAYRSYQGTIGTGERRQHHWHHPQGNQQAAQHDNSGTAEHRHYKQQSQGIAYLGNHCNQISFLFTDAKRCSHLFEQWLVII